MKWINKNKLIEILKQTDREELDFNSLKVIMNNFGDEYFIKDGQLELTNKGKDIQENTIYKI